MDFQWSSTTTDPNRGFEDETIAGKIITAISKSILVEAMLDQGMSDFFRRAYFLARAQSSKNKNGPIKKVSVSKLTMKFDELISFECILCIRSNSPVSTFFLGE